MGEIADYYLSMEDPWDWDDEYWCQYDREPEDQYSLPKTCKHCGANWLHWGITERGWRLFTEGNKLHVCKPYVAIKNIRRIKRHEISSEHR